MPKAIIETTATVPVPDGVLLSLSLDQIVLDPITDVRVGATPKDEERQIELLAKSIHEHGQLQPVVVRANGTDGKYQLIAGRRRFAALQLVAEKAEPRPIRAILVEKSDEEAFASAVQENIRRRDFSPIEFANLVLTVKERIGANGKDWTSKVADFLSVSRATITQSQKLLTLPKKTQDDVNSGRITQAAAIQLADIESPVQQEQVAQVAKEMAKAEAAAAPKKAKGVSKDQDGANNGKKAAKNAGNEVPDRVSERHIAKAIKEVAADTKLKSRTRNDILDFFTEINSESGYADVMVEFAQTLATKWLPGKITNRVLLNRWDAISELVDLAAKKQKRKASAA